MMKDLRDGDDETNIDIGNKISLRAGFEPARENPIGFRVQRLNHSAITAQPSSWNVIDDCCDFNPN